MGRYDIAKGTVPGKAAPLNVDPVVKYNANRHMKWLMENLRLEEKDIVEYTRHLSKTMTREQVASVYSDWKRLVTSFNNFRRGKEKSKYDPRRGLRPQSISDEVDEVLEHISYPRR